MQYSHKMLAVPMAAIIAVGVSISSVSAQTAPAAPTLAKTIGIIDRDKVVTGYQKAQSAAEELKRSEEDVQKLVEGANKAYEEAKKANKPPAELEGLQRRLQAKIDDQVKQLQSRVAALESTLETEIDGAIRAEASVRKVDVVFMKQAVLLGGVDLTEGVVKRLTMANTQSASKTGGAAK